MSPELARALIWLDLAHMHVEYARGWQCRDGNFAAELALAEVCRDEARKRATEFHTNTRAAA